MCMNFSSKTLSVAGAQDWLQECAVSQEGCLWVFSRRLGGEARRGCSPGKGSPPAVMSLSPVLAVWLLHGLTWLSALKTTRQEFKELLLSC